MRKLTETKTHSQVCKKEHACGCTAFSMTQPKQLTLQCKKHAVFQKKTRSQTLNHAKRKINYKKLKTLLQQREEVSKAIKPQTTEDLLVFPEEQIDPDTSLETNVQKHWCHICRKYLSSSAQFRFHMNSHLGIKPWACDICPRSFSDPSTWRKHCDSHLNVGKFKCKLCKKAFSTKQYLHRHQQVHEEKKFRCQICERTFLRKAGLQTHMFIHSGEKPFECPTCGTLFRSKYTLQVHKRVHTGERPFKCQICGHAFIDRPSMKKHEAIHTNSWPVKCDQCGKGFRNRTDLNKHHVTHSDIRAYSCEECGFRLKTRQSLLAHKRTHTNYKPFVCDQCPAAFRTKYNMEVHRRTHSGELPFECHLCFRRFMQTGYLKKHIVQVHENRRPFKCFVCEKAFKRFPHLRHHMESLHTHVTSSGNIPFRVLKSRERQAENGGSSCDDVKSETDPEAVSSKECTGNYNGNGAIVFHDIRPNEQCFQNKDGERQTEIVAAAKGCPGQKRESRGFEVNIVNNRGQATVVCKKTRVHGAPLMFMPPKSLYESKFIKKVTVDEKGDIVWTRVATNYKKPTGKPTRGRCVHRHKKNSYEYDPSYGPTEGIKRNELRHSQKLRCHKETIKTVSFPSTISCSSPAQVNHIKLENVFSYHDYGLNSVADVSDLLNGNVQSESVPSVALENVTDAICSKYYSPLDSLALPVITKDELHDFALKTLNVNSATVCNSSASVALQNSQESDKCVPEASAHHTSLQVYLPLSRRLPECGLSNASPPPRLLFQKNIKVLLQNKGRKQCGKHSNKMLTKERNNGQWTSQLSGSRFSGDLKLKFVRKRKNVKLKSCAIDKTCKKNDINTKKSMKRLKQPKVLSKPNDRHKTKKSLKTISKKPLTKAGGKKKVCDNSSVMTELVPNSRVSPGSKLPKTNSRKPVTKGGREKKCVIIL